MSIFTQHCEHKLYPTSRSGQVGLYLGGNFPGAQYYSVYEAGFSGFWIHDQLRAKGIDYIVVTLADGRPGTKNEPRSGIRSTAANLPGVFEAGRLKESTFLPEEAGRSRSDPDCQNMVRKQTRCKNQIKAILFFYGVVISEGREMGHWSRRFIRWIERIRMERTSGDIALKAHLKELSHLRQLIASLNRAILRLARTEEYRSLVRLLKSVPGISTLTAMILLSELGEVTRFPSLDKLSCYVGLIPGTSRKW